MADLLSAKKRSGASENSYSAADIEVLEGLEPVRRRPGMYIGGTDDRALQHLVVEVLDNAMDEAVAGHASKIELILNEDGSITITDNGRGIPVDPHPKFPKQSALEVILTTLHSGGKFNQKSYETSGGLHGVGVSVVNALSDNLIVEVARDKTLYRQTYSKGTPTSSLEKIGATTKRGTSMTFYPDFTIFDKGSAFHPKRLYHLARSKAFLYSGVSIHWQCAESLIKDNTPTKGVLHFPHGLAQFLTEELADQNIEPGPIFKGETQFADKNGRIEWAVCWPDQTEGFTHSYCNTIVTPQGGTHEAGMRQALLQGIRAYGDRINDKSTAKITGDDVLNGASIIISVFIREPHFQGQTKEKLVSREVTRWVENAMKDPMDLWLASNPAASRALLDQIIQKMEERLSRKDQKNQSRKTLTKRLRLPGKLADCSRNSTAGTEIFIVEGDSASGSAKQARNRETQAILPLRGKILNVESASSQKMMQNQEINDLTVALGCQLEKQFKLDDLRYERIIIMTDADVDGAHIASLLLTFFFTKMPGLVESGRVYLAQPPLYRLVQGKKSAYARDDADKDRLMKTMFDASRKIDISRFKGLGEMPAAQLKETTMDYTKRQLLRVQVNEAIKQEAQELVQNLMGKKAETRFRFIQDNAAFAKDLDV
jgi:topoisomerase-4 subunit B